MANKSVISIDVNDSKFKEFAAAFAKYQDALKAMPKDWDKSNAASGKHAADAEKALKKIQKAQKDLNKDIDDGLSLLKGVSKVTGDIAANFASSASDSFFGPCPLRSVDVGVVHPANFASFSSPI